MKAKDLHFQAGWKFRHVHADVHAGALMNPLAGGKARFFGDVGADRFDRFPFRSGADMAVVFEHGSVQVTGNAHDGLVRGFAFRQFRDGKVPEVMEPKPPDPCGGAFPSGDGGTKTATILEGFTGGSPASAMGRFLDQ